MKKFINQKQYTDVKSWMVYDIDEEKGTAMAIAVEKHIDPQMVPGGFSAICLNNSDFNKTDEFFPVSGAEPFKITRKNGVWGYMKPRCIFHISEDQLAIPFEEYLKANPNAEEGEKDDQGHRQAFTYLRTKSGKVQMTFEKLGELTDTCRYFYDFNF